MANIALLWSGTSVIKMANRAWSVGEMMYPSDTETYTTSINNARSVVWECTTAGTSTGNPTWPISAPTINTTTVTQNGVVWMARLPGNNGAGQRDWAYAAPYYMNLLQSGSATFSTGTAVDAVHIASDHVEGGTAVGRATAILTSANKATPQSPFPVISVNRGSGLPEKGARIITAGTISPIFQSSFYHFGVTLDIGGSGASSVTLANVAGCHIFEECVLNLKGPTGASTLQVGSSAASVGAEVRFINTNVSFAAANGTIGVHTTFRWHGGRVPLVTANRPTYVFTGGTRNTNAVITGVDFSALSNLTTLFKASAAGVGSAVFRGCTLPPEFSSNLCEGPIPAGFRFAFYAADGQYAMKSYEACHSGQVSDSVSIYRNGGAHDGIAPFAWAISTAMASNSYLPYESNEIAVWNEVINTPITLTAHLAMSPGNAALTQQDAWLEAFVPDTADGANIRYTGKPSPYHPEQVPATLPSSNAQWQGFFGTPVLQKVTLTCTAKRVGFIMVKVVLSGSSRYIQVCPKVEVS